MKSQLNEISSIRACACLSIVLLHAIKMEIGFFYNGDGFLELALMNLAGLLSYGTAAFVMISEILIAYNYKLGLTTTFYRKKYKYVLVPFIVMAIFYGIVRGVGTVPERILTNLVGGYHGWFVLVIFQFYLLHGIYEKRLADKRPTVVLTVSFLITMSYLAFFNFVPQPSEGLVIDFLWSRGYWMPFVGWLFYFSLAYYIGKHYKAVVAFVQTNQQSFGAAMIAAGLIVVFNNQWLDLGYGSKRFDMVLFTTLAILYLLGAVSVSKLKDNVFIKLISGYSFGIYLMHYFYLLVIQKLIETIPYEVGYLSIGVMFVGSLGASVATVYIANRLPYGEFIVGKVHVEKISFMKHKTIPKQAS